VHPLVAGIPAVFVGYALAGLLGGGSLIWLLRRADLGAGQIAVSLVAIAVALVAGSKALYLVEAWPHWVSPAVDPWQAIWSTKMRIPGGLALAIAIGPLLARAIGAPYLRFADASVPAAGLLLVGIRIGCFLEGCCFGTPSSLPWAIAFPASSPASGWQVAHGWIDPTAQPLPVHPLQLYFAGAGLLLFVGLAVYERHKRFHGEVLLLFFAIYLWSTFALELLRASPHDLTRQAVLAASVAVTLVAIGAELAQRSPRWARVSASS
jgi:phosphatidylglycerol:prolipoprotein diacylglycerol transferase